MNQHGASALIAATVLIVSHTLAADLEEVGDPVRNAQRLKDCTALYAEAAGKNGMTEKQFYDACVKAINDRTFKDDNISLDGMIKSPSPAM